MNDKNWLIDLPNGAQDVVQCEVCGVAQDGSLICFVLNGDQPQAVRGYAPGQWIKFVRSTVLSN
jgi:hypothetical protein